MGAPQFGQSKEVGKVLFSSPDLELTFPRNEPYLCAQQIAGTKLKNTLFDLATIECKVDGNDLIYLQGIYHDREDSIIDSDVKIVFLNPSKIVRLIDVRLLLSEESGRLAAVISGIKTGIFLIPAIRCSADGRNIHFDNGHHRTAVLARHGIKSAPYLTRSNMIKTITEHFGASFRNDVFDLSRINYQSIS